MGISLCKEVKKSSNPTSSLQYTGSSLYDARQDQFDNPKRLQLSSHFLKTHFMGSRDKMRNDCKGSKSPKRPDTQILQEKPCGIFTQINSDFDNFNLKLFFQIYNQIPPNNIQRKIQKKKFIDLRRQNIGEKYDFLYKIGEGSYGRVYKARNRYNGEIKAIKVVKRNDLAGHVKEIEMLKECDHAHIIKLYQIYEYGNECYFVTEFCQGGSIINYLSRKNIPKMEALIKEFANQLLNVINYLHCNDISHRDIKAENVVLVEPLKEDNSNLNIKLIDFGSAAKMSFKVNRDRVMSGTMVYMPPEGFEGWYSRSYDMWSFGVLLYFLLSGEVPFRGVDKKTIRKMIRDNPLTFPGERWKGISEEAKDLIRAILQKDLHKRVTPKECMGFSWLSKDPVIKVTSFRKASEKIIKKVTSYTVKNSFVSIIESYLTFLKITHQERKEMLVIFEVLDFKKKGTLSKSDISEAFEKAFGCVGPEIIDNIIRKIDKNKSGVIDFSEFEVMMIDRKRLYVESSLGEAFDFYDRDNSGFIDKNELKELLQHEDSQTGLQLSNLLQQIDINMDGGISRQEFLNYLMGIEISQSEEIFSFPSLPDPCQPDL